MSFIPLGKSGLFKITAIEANVFLFLIYNSLIANDIVRAGKGVLGKPDLDECLYTTHMQMKTTTPYPIPETFKEYIMAFTAAVSTYALIHVVAKNIFYLFFLARRGWS